MANEATPYYDPADTTTCYVEAAVTGKRLVALSGPRVDGLAQVSPAGAGARAYGVASRDAAAGAKVMVAHVGVWPVTAGAPLTAGQDVQADATGQAIPLAAGVRVGTVIDDVASGADAPIRLSL